LFQQDNKVTTLCQKEPVNTFNQVSHSWSVIGNWLRVPSATERVRQRSQRRLGPFSDADHSQTWWIKSAWSACEVGAKALTAADRCLGIQCGTWATHWLLQWVV